MSPKKKRSRIEEEEDEKQDYYHAGSLNSLPDELLLLLFSKITDPKTLFLSSLVSKRIASILSHSQSLSLQFQTRQIPFSDETPTLKYLRDLCLPLTNLLRRFNGVRSLRIELPCSCRCPDDVVFKWKAKTGVRCGILSFLSTKFVTKINHKKIKAEKEEEEEEEEEEENLVLPFEVFGPWVYASKMYLMMLVLISQYPNLHSIEFVDSKKHGKLSLRGEELIKLRTAENWNFIGSPSHQKIWCLPKLRLPLSGFEMKEVVSVLIRGDKVANGKMSGGGGMEEEVQGNVEDVLDGGFEDDEHGIFHEAMAQLLARHPSTTFSV